jgi:hypothetical protein
MKALVLYKSEDPNNKSFQFMHCWNVLKNHQKWIDWSSQKSSSQKKQKTAPSSSPSSFAPCALEDDEAAAQESEVPTEAQPIGMVDEGADLSPEGNNSVDWGGGELMVSAPEDQSWPIGVVTCSGRQKSRRTKNFSNEEDELLALSWLNVSTEYVQGSERFTYWQRICDYYHSKKDIESNRNQNSLMHRWSTIQDSVSKFERCLARIEGTSQNGVITQDEVSFCLLDLVFTLHAVWKVNMTFQLYRSCKQLLYSSLKIRTTSHFSFCIAGIS